MEGDAKAADGPTDEKLALKNHTDDGAAVIGDYTPGNESTVKFVNGDAEVAINGTAKEKKADEFVGLKKEELAKYATDPYWVKVRIILFVVFALAWVAMLAIAIAIIAVAPKCPPRPDLEWHQKAIIYHIHPQSFLDTNKDQFGDIQGIHDKIDYLKDTLHVGAVCIGPMNPTPTFEYGYNIINYKTVCPGHYGSEEDLESLRIALHKKGLKLVLDFIPNHTSRKHPWFVNSSSSTSHQDYYIWAAGKNADDTTPPNGWLNVYGDPAWTYNSNRKAFYYHTFSEDEPDLNLRNPAVIAELDDSLMYWLKKRIDGFRIYGVQYLFEPNITAAEASFQPDNYKLVNHWRELLDNYSRNDGRAKSRYYPRLLMAEVSSATANQTAQFMKQGDQLGAQIATNLALTKIKEGCGAKCVHDLITGWTSEVTEDTWSNWQLGNIDVSRVATRMGGSVKYVNVLNMMLLTLPGTPIVYYGEEIGMKDVTRNASQSNPCEKLGISMEQCMGRLAQRSPMQWNDEQFAGFTEGNGTWLNVGTDYFHINVAGQLAHGAGISPITVFSNVAKLRSTEPSLLWGKFYPGFSSSVFFYLRQAEGFGGFLVAINIGNVPTTVNFKEALTQIVPESVSEDLPEEMTMAVSTGHFEGPGRTDAFKEGTAVRMDHHVYMIPGEGIIFRWEPKAFSL